MSAQPSAQSMEPLPLEKPAVSAQPDRQPAQPDKPPAAYAVPDSADDDAADAELLASLERDREMIELCEQLIANLSEVEANILENVGMMAAAARRARADRRAHRECLQRLRDERHGRRSRSAGAAFRSPSPMRAYQHSVFF
ncbi:hypothetical pox protein [Squirrelpox virus]|uniref:C12R n=1 Tax=Squirrelpox virus TaxID=240426 RepID=Q1HTQ1_9POXV|nr:hypothetical pox protein [Squirrelpox virus]ABD51485.1 C12R [Squirrelpox virus]CCD83317.1 hypothetical pox protein [Squirrelpox virus]